MQDEQTILREDIMSKDYTDFQNVLSDSLDGVLYEQSPVLVTIQNDSNFDENDSVNSFLYFTDEKAKYRLQFPLSAIGTETESTRSYYASCPTVSDMILVEPFQAATINSYVADKFYILKNELWQIVVDDRVGVLYQYFKVDEDGKIIKQVNVLQAVAKATDENVDAATANFDGWSFQQLRDFIDSSTEKTVSTYVYNDLTKLKTQVSLDKWLKIALKASQKAPEPLFTTSTGQFIDNISSSSDGLTCLLEP